MPESYNLITFKTTHASIAADKLLEERGIPRRLIPIPGEISAGCGFCLRIEPENLQNTKAALSESNIAVSDCYAIRKQRFRSRITKLEEI